MRGSRRSEEQIIRILKQAEKGMATAELCRQEGISEQTFYRWKAKYGGLDSGDAKKLKQVEEENRKLKYVVAEQYAISERHACRLVGVARSTKRYPRSAKGTGDGVATADQGPGSEPAAVRLLARCWRARGTR
jgi:putative transposase